VIFCQNFILALKLPGPALTAAIYSDHPTSAICHQVARNLLQSCMLASQLHSTPSLPL